MTKRAGNSKVTGRKLVDSERRPRRDEGGQAPLTLEAVVPVGAIFPLKLIYAIEKRSDQFISPTTFKPYGFTATARIILTMMIDKIDRYDKDDYLAYIRESEKEPGVRGRVGFSGESTKISLLIPKSIVEAINKKVLEYDSALIGTSTIARLLIEEGLKRVTIQRMYSFIPAKHKDLMVAKQHTIASLQSAYLKRRSK